MYTVSFCWFTDRTKTKKNAEFTAIAKPQCKAVPKNNNSSQKTIRGNGVGDRHSVGRGQLWNIKRVPPFRSEKQICYCRVHASRHATNEMLLHPHLTAQSTATRRAAPRRATPYLFHFRHASCRILCTFYIHASICELWSEHIYEFACTYHQVYLCTSESRSAEGVDSTYIRNTAPICLLTIIQVGKTRTTSRLSPNIGVVKRLSSHNYNCRSVYKSSACTST